MTFVMLMDVPDHDRDPFRPFAVNPEHVVAVSLPDAHEQVALVTLVTGETLRASFHTTSHPNGSRYWEVSEGFTALVKQLEGVSSDE